MIRHRRRRPRRSSAPTTTLTRADTGRNCPLRQSQCRRACRLPRAGIRQGARHPRRREPRSHGTGRNHPRRHRGGARPLIKVAAWPKSNRTNSMGFSSGRSRTPALSRLRTGSRPCFRTRRQIAAKTRRRAGRSLLTDQARRLRPPAKTRAGCWTKSTRIGLFGGEKLVWIAGRRHGKDACRQFLPVLAQRAARRQLCDHRGWRPEEGHRSSQDRRNALASVSPLPATATMRAPLNALDRPGTGPGRLADNAGRASCV